MAKKTDKKDKKKPAKRPDVIRTVVTQPDGTKIVTTRPASAPPPPGGSEYAEGGSQFTGPPAPPRKPAKQAPAKPARRAQAKPPARQAPQQMDLASVTPEELRQLQNAKAQLMQRNDPRWRQVGQMIDQVLAAKMAAQKRRQ